MEHIQMVPTEVKAVSGGVSVDKCELRVEGRPCLQEPTPECRDAYEEIILWSVRLCAECV